MLWYCLARKDSNLWSHDPELVPVHAQTVSSCVQGVVCVHRAPPFITQSGVRIGVYL